MDLTGTLSLLLHVCCATCAASVLSELQQKFRVTAFYYNPNIFPAEEYRIRRGEVRSFCERNGVPFIEVEPDFRCWEQLTAGHGADRERGGRCNICYTLRLEQTAAYAQEHKFDLFGTDLSISPKKDALKLNQIGAELSQRYGVRYLEANFKKRGGFDRAMAVSRQQNFYRQTYCGCRYSLEARQAGKRRLQADTVQQR
ncbi:MAG: epoxyqueuosine reductase QueH [Patescibacteria group bacterium]